MIKVAHRGNYEGRNPAKENSISYIERALERGYHVEVDVWKKNGRYLLGHDSPQYDVKDTFLQNKKLICHAKNIEAFHSMLEDDKIHCFWHEQDLCTLTSRSWIWMYPEIYFKGKLWGICSDWL
jgi:hypothetical protein